MARRPGLHRGGHSGNNHAFLVRTRRNIRFDGDLKIGKYWVIHKGCNCGRRDSPRRRRTRRNKIQLI